MGDVDSVGCGHSSADLNEPSETAVRGSEDSADWAFLNTDTTEGQESAGLVLVVEAVLVVEEKGFGTSLATLMTVSNCEASSRLGSR